METTFKRKFGKKTYYGEEAETVTLKDCQAAYKTIAMLKAGQIDFSDILVAAPPNKPIAEVSA